MGPTSTGSLGGRPPAARVRPRRRGERSPAPGLALVVDGSPIVAKMLAKSIAAMEGYTAEVSTSAAGAIELIGARSGQLTAAVVDLDVDEGRGAEVVAAAAAHGVPAVALLASYDDATRQAALEGGVVDYFVKGERSVAPLKGVLERLRVNPSVKILVADDSAGFRLVTKRLLEAHRFAVLEARDGQEALEVFDASPDVTLVITDYEMPRRDGVELVTALRDRKGREELAIIGVSALGDRALPARYLKHGADDFLTKPFEKEEFYCRVYRSVTNVEQIQRIVRAAYTDALTGLRNRLHFFTHAPDLFAKAIAEGREVAVAMADIDHFKRINDTYGHAGGDAALEHVAGLLEASLPEADLIARFGGEEFCALAVGAGRLDAQAAFERLRAAVEGSAAAFEDELIRFTVSVGVATVPAGSLDATINRADELLYRAKEAGRNRVVLDLPADRA